MAEDSNDPVEIDLKKTAELIQQVQFKPHHIHALLLEYPAFADAKMRDKAMRFITRSLTKPTEWFSLAELRHNFHSTSMEDGIVIVTGLLKLKVFKATLYKSKTFYMINLEFLARLQDPKYDLQEATKSNRPPVPEENKNPPKIVIIDTPVPKEEHPAEFDGDYKRFIPKPGQKGHTKYLIEIERLKLEYLENECKDLMWVIFFGRRDTIDWRTVFNQRKMHLAAWLVKYGDYKDWTEAQRAEFYANLEKIQMKVYGRILCDFDWETKEIVILPIEASPYKGTVPSRLPCPYSGNREIPLYIENFYPNQSRKDGFP